jgi:hypothetical protein
MPAGAADLGRRRKPKMASDNEYYRDPNFPTPYFTSAGNVV